MYEPEYVRIFVGLHGTTALYCALIMLILWECIDIRGARVESRRIRQFSVASIVLYWITSIVFRFSALIFHSILCDELRNLRCEMLDLSPFLLFSST